MKIAILGAKGSFTEEAAISYAERHKLKLLIEHFESSEQVFRAVTKGTAGLGIVPISNSVGGIVHDSIAAMSKYNFAPVLVFEMPVKQNLMILPSTNIEEIESVVSHPQALSQCRLYLARNWLKLEKRPYSSTSKAASDLASGKLSKYSAVIASDKSAQIYGLKVIAEGIQDSRFNFTEFLVFSKKEEGKTLEHRIQKKEQEHA